MNYSILFEHLANLVVKLNNPQMGTEINRFFNSHFSYLYALN